MYSIYCNIYYLPLYVSSLLLNIKFRLITTLQTLVPIHPSFKMANPSLKPISPLTNNRLQACRAVIVNNPFVRAVIPPKLRAKCQTFCQWSGQQWAIDGGHLYCRLSRGSPHVATYAHLLAHLVVELSPLINEG